MVKSWIQAFRTALALTIVILVGVNYTFTIKLGSFQEGYNKRDELARTQVQQAYQAGMSSGLSQCPQTRPNRALEHTNIYSVPLYLPMIDM